MAQVDPVVTDYTPAQIAGAFVAAYRQLTGQDPPSSGVWLFPTAQSVKGEGWQGQYAFNNNIGNITTYGQGGTDWYYNPHVTDPLKFESFSTLTDGALGMLKMLKAHGALAAAENGDLDGYCAALSPWYLGAGGDYDAYCRNIRAGASEYAGLVPAPPSTGTWKLALGAIAIVGVSGAAAWWWTNRKPAPSKRRRPALAMANPAGASRKTIVVAWTEAGTEFYGPEARVDQGERRKTRPTLIPRAALWKASGTDADIEKARAYARSQGPEYRVFVYATTDKRWKQNALDDILSASGREARERPAMNVQSVLVPASWKPETALAWVEDHGFSAKKVDTTERFYRFRQQDPGKFKVLRTISFGDSGVKAVVGRAA